ncbi:flagellar biosynthetic protein FliR [Pseudomonadota bacterium]
MNIQYDALVSQISWYLLPFFRISGFIMVAPIFSTGFVPVKIRLGLAVMLGLMVLPLLTPDTRLDGLSVGTISLVIQQIIIGVTLGFVLQLIFAAAVNAGQLVGMQMGLGFAQMMDPQTGVSVPVVSQFYNLMAVLLFLSMNGHLVLIQILVDSFSILPIGAGMLPTAGFESLALFASWMFSGAVLIALPAILSLLMISMVMGVITKATPQMNIFAVGFAISIILGFIIIAVTLSTAFPQMANLFGEGFTFMREVLKR